MEVMYFTVFTSEILVHCLFIKCSQVLVTFKKKKYIEISCKAIRLRFY